jgi:ABC-2 type transport system ATP-binding protein
VIFSTHVMQHAERLCDQVVLMAAGRKVFDGTVAAARKVAPRSVVLEGPLDADVLNGLPGLIGLAVERLDGGALRIVATLDPSAPAQIVLGEVFAKGLTIDRFELREPNLHEAFILLTTARAGAGPAA